MDKLTATPVTYFTMPPFRQMFRNFFSAEKVTQRMLEEDKELRSMVDLMKQVLFEPLSLSMKFHKEYYFLKNKHDIVTGRTLYGCLYIECDGIRLTRMNKVYHLKFDAFVKQHVAPVLANFGSIVKYDYKLFDTNSPVIEFQPLFT